MIDEFKEQKKEEEKQRRTIKNMSEEFYAYGTLTKYDFDQLKKLNNKKYLYLALSKDGKQLGLFLTTEQAFSKFDNANDCQMWELNEKTGQYHPTNASVGRLELVEKRK